MTVWSRIIDGTAIGPTIILPVQGEEIIIMALWDDERGVQVDAHLLDLTLNASEWATIHEAVTQLLATPAPSVAR